MRLATIPGIPGNTGICEYIKDVWEDSKYINTLEIARRFTNDEMITEARRVRSTEMKPFQRLRKNGVWWLGSGEHRRRDDEEVAPVQNKEVNEEAEGQRGFDWEAVIDEAALQGESGSDDKFFDAQVEVEEPAAKAPTVLVFSASPGDSTNVQKEPAIAGVDPSAPTGSIPDSVFSSLKANFERAHANRIQANLERAQAENARLLFLLQQAQSQPKP
ncbi:hypothetical protein Dimus_010678 [Dionaea muscipula]